MIQKLLKLSGKARTGLYLWLSSTRNSIKGKGLIHWIFLVHLKKLADTLLQTYKVRSKNIHLSMDLEENVFFDMDTAVPLGIIVNELVSNSLKHAFTGRDKGEIRIKLGREEP